MNITNGLEHSVLDFLTREDLNSTSRILVGFSGGPDSSVLLHVLRLLQEEFGYSLSALYVDHGIRAIDIMERECRLVAAAAQRMGVALDIIHIPHGKITSLAFAEKRSIEEVARKFRYDIFAKKMEGEKSSFLALGHNFDDTVETIIMRIFQGSGIHGLTGIPQISDFILRPLGSVEKKVILSYAEKNNIRFVFDETNRETIYLRNKIRHQLIPEIHRIFPGYKKALFTMSEKLKMADFFIQKATKNLSSLSNDEGVLALSVDEFFSLTPFERMEVLYESWDKWKGKPFPRLKYRNIRQILHARKGKTTGIFLEGHDFSFVYSENRFSWRRLVVSPKKSYLRVVAPGRYRIPSGAIVEIVSSTFTLDTDAWVYTCLLQGPLILRSKKPGDSISLKEGRKSLKKLFGEWKVPEADRWRIPLVSDKSGILLVLGEEFGYKNRVTVRHKKTGLLPSGEKLVFNTYMEK